MGVQNVVSFVGVFILIFIAWLLSNNRSKTSLRVILWGTGLQFIFAILVFKFPPGRKFFLILNDVVIRLLDFTIEGSKFVFGPLAVGPGSEQSMGFFFAFQVLPTIIFFSSLMSIMYYLGIMQKLVLFFAKIMTKTMDTSGAESLSAAANIFVGQTEAPLVIRPYVEKMTNSELMAVMTGGMATVAGGVMGAYVMMLKGYFPTIAGHLISASVLSAPAALVMAKVMIPETETPMTKGTVRMVLPKTDENIIDAAAKGAGDGLTLALNVGGMLLAFVALIAMVNFGVARIGDGIDTLRGKSPYMIELTTSLSASIPDDAKIDIKFDEKTIMSSRVVYAESNWLKIKDRAIMDADETDITIMVSDNKSINVKGKTRQGLQLSLEKILGWLFIPFAWIMGVAWKDCMVVGRLLGEKIILTEFIAYLDLSKELALSHIRDERSVVIATYALCGFANFASIAIQIGGIGGIAPSRRGDLAKLGVQSVIAGTLAAFMTANIAGIFYTKENVVLGKPKIKPIIQTVSPLQAPTFYP